MLLPFFSLFGLSVGTKMLYLHVQDFLFSFSPAILRYAFYLSKRVERKKQSTTKQIERKIIMLHYSVNTTISFFFVLELCCLFVFELRQYSSVFAMMMNIAEAFNFLVDICCLFILIPFSHLVKINIIIILVLAKEISKNVFFLLSALLC